MHCPCCGKQFSEGEKFCRSCGMNLEATAVAVASHHSSEGAGLVKESFEKKLARGGTIVAGSGLGIIVLTVIGIVIALAGDAVFGLNSVAIINKFLPLMLGLGVPIFLIGASMLFYSGLSRDLFHRRKSSRVIQSPSGATRVLKAPPDESLTPLITEQTTRDMEPVSRETPKTTK